MKKIVYLALALLLAPLASAHVGFTEVMFDPVQTESQTDAEWIEVFNYGNESVDLSDWKVDGNNFDDVVLGSKEYLVIARELLDGDDADNESFESYWGNNDGVWDEGYNAVDGYFSLGVDDTINLSNGSVSVVESYSGFEGGGKSIIKVNGSWENGVMDGTPGRGEGALLEGEVGVEANIANVAPEIVSKEIVTDDSSQNGVQVMPNVDENKSVDVTMEVTDANWDNLSAGVRVDGREYWLQMVKGENQTLTFNGSFEMKPTDIATFYPVEFFAQDNSSEVAESMQFEYLGILSSVIETAKMTFDNLLPGSLSGEKFVNVRNAGNVVFDTEIEGFDLSSDDATIEKGGIEVFKDIWYPLSIPRLLNLDVQPGQTGGLRFRLNVPAGLKAQSFNGKVRVTTVES